MAQAKQAANPSEAEALVKQSCLKSCKPFSAHFDPRFNKKRVGFASSSNESCCPACGNVAALSGETNTEVLPETRIPGANMEFVDLMFMAPEREPSYRGKVTGIRENQWTWEGLGDTRGMYKINEECIAVCYREGMHTLAPTLGELKTSDEVYRSCRYGCTNHNIVATSRPRDRKLKSSINDFAPQFSDFINSKNAGFLGRDYYMDNGLMEPYEPESEDAGLGEHQLLEHHKTIATAMASAFQTAKSRITTAVPEAIAKVVAELSTHAHPERAKLNMGVVLQSFFSHSHTKGVTLVELCAGIGVGPEAALLAGIKVNKYFYVDIDPLASDLAKFRVANPCAKFPELFPPSAWEYAFASPHDINSIRDFQIDHFLAGAPQQILLTAGWPCRQYSPAGKGRP
jgi:hypothetical protein